MAIIKSVAKASKSKTGAKALLDYVAKKAEFTYGINCSEDYKLANKEFQETKEFYNKLEGRQYKHIVQSFKEGEVDKEQALKIGVEFCKKAFPKYEVFIATHTDKNHIHNHIVINSVNYENGKKLHLHGQKAIDKVRNLSDELCKERGLSVVKEPNSKVRYTLAEQGILERGETSWKDELRQAIDYEKVVRGNKLGLDYERGTIENVFNRQVERESSEDQRNSNLSDRKKSAARNP